MKANTNNVDLKQLSKESIVQSLCLLMQEKPYHQITITDVCKKAGVSRNAFYRNYPSKDAILRRYLYEETDVWRRGLRNNKTISSYQYFTLLFTQCAKFNDLTKKMCEANLDYLLIDLFFTFYKDLTKETPKATYLQCHMAGSIYAVFIHWIMNKQPETPEDIAKMLCEFNHISVNAKMHLSPSTDIDKLMSSPTFVYRE